MGRVFARCIENQEGCTIPCMARTAPVPNLPPIPGMCPSIAVLAGGGDGGGGNGNGAGDGDGDANGDGNNDGSDASGDDTNGGNGCGDPVCPITGRVFLDVLDFGFNGPLPIKLIRSYNSRTSNLWGELGHGWSHNLGLRLRVRRSHILLVDERAKEQRFEGALAVGQRTTNGMGWELAHEQTGYVLYRRGQSAVRFGPETADGQHLTVAVEDRNHNVTTVVRDDRGIMRGIRDSAGRNYRVRVDETGRLVEIWVEQDSDGKDFMRVVAYTYDDDGNLASATDAEGFTFRYAYDGHLLIQNGTPVGLTYCYRYDSKGHQASCLETWGEYLGKQDPALEPPLPPRPADGPDKRGVKGIHYAKLTFDKATRYSEVENGLGGVERFFGDAAGRVTKHVTFTGGIVEKVFDRDTGALVAIAEEDGPPRAIAEGPDGAPNGTRPVERFTMPDGTQVEIDEATGARTEQRFDPRGNLTYVRYPDGTVEETEYDTRGLVTRQIDRKGTTTFFDWDAMGNCTAIDRAAKRVELSEYDYLGRRTAHIDSMGNRTEWRWDRRSEMTQKKHADGSAINLEIDGFRRVTMMEESGRVTRWEYGGLGWPTKVTRADGTAYEYRYNVQGRLVWVKNPRGQVFTQQFDHAGRWVGCTTFEGLVHRARWSAANQLVWMSGPTGRRDVLEHDENGRLVAVDVHDGKSVSLEYVGDKMVVDSDGVRVDTRRDVMGRVASETQDRLALALTWAGGEIETVALVDKSGAPIGPTLEFGYDRAGELDRVSAAGHELQLDRRDGADLVTVLDDAVVLRRTFGPTKLLLWQGVAKRRAGLALSQTATPDDPGLSFAIEYRYDEHQILREEKRSDGTTIAYETTVRNQITQKTVYRDGRVIAEEAIAYDDAGTPRMAGATYDLAMRPTSLNGERFEYDVAGQLIKRHADAGTTTYEWDGLGNLARVLGPKNRRVEMRYDGRGRRLSKKVFDDQRLLKDISYAYSENSLLHEVDHLVKKTRTYLRNNGQWATAGHVDSGPDGASAFLYMRTPNEGVDTVFAADGSLAYAADRTIYGVPTPTTSTVDVSLGFANQYWDEDVGLVYNRFRWYDPRLGLYVSPDPLLLGGTLNPRDYVSNPRFFIDPMGEMGRTPSSEPSPGSPGGAPANHPGRPARPADSAAMDLDHMTNPGHFATNGNPGGPPGFINCPTAAMTASGGWDHRPGELIPPATTPPSIRSQIDAAGSRYGCHTCGSRNSAGPDGPDPDAGHFVPDHIPPVSTFAHGHPRNSPLPAGTAPPVGEVRLYPQCRRCSNSQGGMMSHATAADRARIGARRSTNASTNPRP